MEDNEKAQQDVSEKPQQDDGEKPQQDVKDVLAAIRLLLKSGHDLEQLLEQSDSLEGGSGVEEPSVLSKLKDLAREQQSLSERIKSMTGDGHETDAKDNEAAQVYEADAQVYEADDNDERNSETYENRSTTSEPPPPPVYCTPELQFVTWDEASSSDLPDQSRVTIQIPTNQPAVDYLKPRHDASQADRQPPSDSDKRRAPDGSDKPKPFQRGGLPRGPQAQPLEELPDRVRICSDRLAVYLDYSLHDGSLHRNSSTSLSFLRPFKFLVEKNEEIRDELVEMKRIRQERFPGISEEAFHEQWEEDPPQDNIPQEAVNFEIIEQNQLTALIKDMECLITFMDGYIEPSWKVVELDHVYFTDLWYVFAARSLIYVKDKKVPQKVWKVVQRTSGTREWAKRRRTSGDRIGQVHGYRPLVIDCMHLDYDGTRYVETYKRIQIDYFEGCQSLASLPVVPIRAAEKAKLLDREALLKRGREFVECTRPSHKQYVGRNLTITPNGEYLQRRDADIPENAARYSEFIESEVMIDFERALQEMPSWRPGMDDLDLYKSETDWNRGIEEDAIWDGKLSEMVLEEEAEKRQRWDKERASPTEEDDLLLLPDRVFGFVFRTRKWARLQLGKDNEGNDKLRKKVYRPEPWNDLQLPDGHKRLVQSLIMSHTRDGAHSVHFDLVRSKGKGVTILLHGVPGVGKTSTAECAAEASARPLLPITCGDLGSTPREVEKKLDQAFQLAQVWNCVLLLDEADIFLAQRSENDIARNALVSVFIRAFEYYQGILFLTTNRVGVFDEAFKSRIHISLYYPALEWEYAEKIWRTHIRKLKGSIMVTVDEDDIMSYAKTLFKNQSSKNSMIGPVWNGRQIRNAFQSVVALAAHGCEEGAKIRIEREHFDRVSKVSNEFNHYIWSIKSQSDADKAERWGYRLDSYQADNTTHMKAVQGDRVNHGGGAVGNPGFGQRLTPSAQNGMAYVGNNQMLQQAFSLPGFGMNPAAGFANGMPQGMFPNNVMAQMQAAQAAGGFPNGMQQAQGSFPGMAGTNGIPRTMGGNSPQVGNAQLNQQMMGQQQQQQQ